MNGKTPLRFVLILVALVLSAVLLATRSAGAAPDASLTVQVEPANKGTVNVSPPPPYSNGQTVTLTATPSAGWTFDRWVLASDVAWWDNNWDYRVTVTAAANGFARKDKPANFPLNFTEIWNSLGVNGTLDPNSIRVIEVDGNDNVIDDTVPFQFDQAVDFNAATKAAGTLVLIMEGNTAAGATRRYHVYFDVTGKGFAPPNVPSQITFDPNSTDEGMAAYKLVTPVGTYYYHNKGGGFSSFNDLSGNDWISWNTNPDNAGDFRGIPNIVHPNNGGYFHPGRKGMTSVVLSQGPIKVTFEVYETNKPPAGRDRWRGLWEVYPTYVDFTMVHAPYDYYFLYEGTPGGQLQINSDFFVRSTGVQSLASVAWEEDLPNEEWVFAADPGVGRALYMASHVDDTKVESYANQQGIMTKFGFGRKGAGPLLDKTIVPRQFTWGIMNELTFDGAKPVIYNAYKDLNTNVGAARTRSGATLGSANPLDFTITGDNTIIAYFKPIQFTVNVTASPADKGSVTKSPNKASYNYNETVTLTATPASGWVFAGWSGDLTGTTNPATVTVTKNMNITATFSQSFTVTTSANPADGGTVTLDPPGPTYPPGTQIQVTATPANGFSFTNWSGDLSGTNPSTFVTVNGNMNIVANFSSAQFTFNATSAGNGSVDWTPKKALYGSGDVVTVTATPDSGFYFIGWTGDLTSSLNPLDVTINGNTSITANFAPLVCYTLTTAAAPVDGGTVDVDVPPNCEGGRYLVGTLVTLTATPNAQKRFVGWSGSITGTVSPVQVSINNDMTVVASFEDDVYPLNTTVIGSGSIAKLPDQPAGYFLGQVVTLTATAAPGWTFSGWSGDASGTNPTTPVTINGPTNVTATFTTVGPFTLTVNTTGNGTVDINPEKAEYAFGEIVTLTPQPAPDSVFAGWSGDVTGSANPLRLTMNSNKTVVASFIVPAGPFSDNFNSCSLDSMWSAEQTGDATISYTGRSVKIQLPEGTEHYVNKKLNNAPRLMQDADNRNMELVAKFDSDVTQNYQTQGLLIEQNASTLLRVDFTYDTGQVTVYAGVWTPGKLQTKLGPVTIPAASANYLRLTRAGDKWIVAYSASGADDSWLAAGDFKYTMNVARVGVFAGNLKAAGGTAPGFTADIDFFQNTAEGPMAEDTPLLTVNVVGSGSVSATPPAAELVCGQTVQLRATPRGGAQFTGWSGDAIGTQNPLSMLINRPRTVTATFTAPEQYTLSLPIIIR